jgi:DNA-binding GntR family transcriptional regulator
VPTFLNAKKPRVATRSDNVYKRLREAIITGRARPNERLVETELADWLKVSRTPIRDGLNRLAVEGLVASRRRGWVVREHTAEEIREIYEARAALEGYCARLAAERTSQAELSEIAALHRPNNKGVSASSREHLVNFNDRFHDAIVSAAHNKRLSEMIRKNRTYYFNFRIAELYADEEVEASLAGHEAIVRALLDRNPDRAEREMRSHIDTALKVILAKMR